MMCENGRQSPLVNRDHFFAQYRSSAAGTPSNVELLSLGNDTATLPSQSHNSGSAAQGVLPGNHHQMQAPLVLQERDDPQGCWSQRCDYIRIEPTLDNDFFFYGSNNPAEAPGVAKFISAYTTLETGCLAMTYFFLLHYWRIPFCLPLMVSSQLFLQFVLFFYSDYFCRLAYTIYWRCPGTTQLRYCFCSICDWILVFSFFVSWCAALMILAPVFSTWRKITVLPPLYDLRVSSIATTPLHDYSFLYFHPSVALNRSTACAMLIPTTAVSSTWDAHIVPPTTWNDVHNPPRRLRDPTVPPHLPLPSVDAAASLSLFTAAQQDHSPSRGHATYPLLHKNSSSRLTSQSSSASFRAPEPHQRTGLFTRSVVAEPEMLLNKITRNQTVSSSFPPQTNYAHRLWPNLWLGVIPNSTVGAVLLSDSWIHRKLHFPSYHEPHNATVHVWAVCSDAATLGCDCHGLEAPRVTRPPLCHTGGLCGIEMVPGMPARSSVAVLVREAKKLFHMPPGARDIFICLQDPDTLRDQVTQDVHWGALLGLPFAIVFVLVSARLFFFYLCQAPITVSHDDIFSASTF